MNTQDLVSIIIPVYNVENYLNKCLRSVVTQTYSNLEIILVDDGSTDSSPALCDKWEKSDSRIIVLHKQNGGLGSARNTGLDRAAGKYICFIDSDDYVEKNMVERLVQESETHDAQIVICGNDNVQLRNGTYHEISKNSMPKSILENNNAIANGLADLFAHYYAIPAWNKLYRTSLLRLNHMRFNEHVTVAEDSLFNIPLYKLAERIVSIPDILYHYVSREGSLCNHFNTSWFSDREYAYRVAFATLSHWSPDALNVCKNEFIYQSSVILDFLFEATTSKEIRRSIISTMTNDSLLYETARNLRPITRRNAICASIFSTKKSFLLSLYGRIISFVKKIYQALRQR